MTLAIFNERTGWTLPERALARIREGAPGSVEVRLVGTRQQLFDALPETDYLGGFPFTESQFLELGAKRVRWIQLTGRVGESSGRMRALLRGGVRVTASARARAPQCAEHALMLTLALFRGSPRAARAQNEHRWGATELAGEVRELRESVVGVVGGGAVGNATATLLAALGCEVALVTGGGDDDGLTRPVGVETLALERLEEILGRVDALIVACPFPERAHPIVRRAQLQAMRDRSFLIDVSRDGLVDESDLVVALQREEIAGAGLDVFEHSPPAADSPLWTMPNVIVTPSISAASPRYWDRAADLIVENLQRIEAERPLLDELRLPPEPARTTRR